MNESVPRLAVELMAAFAERTGLAGGSPARRYLWTDAFAVCNFLALARRSGEARFTDDARRLVASVHGVLGRFRSDDHRVGWLSGLSEAEGAAHPTRGGLRIGKPLPERGPEQAFDERLEWERDGQYFHYLTKWIDALGRMAATTKDVRFHVWARELAAVAYRAFRRAPRRLVWKMSVDLSRPLVGAAGQHDALDGYLTCRDLERTAAELGVEGQGPDLGPAIAEFAAMIEGADLVTADPLGLGGLMVDAWRAARLGRTETSNGELPMRLLEAAEEGWLAYAAGGDWRRPPGARLAFRELGLLIGIAALERLEAIAPALPPRARVVLQRLRPAHGLRATLSELWQSPHARQSRTWNEHLDINEVMLATSLVPEGVLDVPA